MNRTSLMIYSILGFLVIVAVVSVNLWVGAHLDEPIPASAPASVKPVSMPWVQKEVPPSVSVLDPKTDPLAPMVIHPPSGEPKADDPANPPKKHYEGPLENGDILAM